MMTESTNYSRDFFTMGQIRLSELSVYNWGSFHGLHSARIDPEGTLVTGDNGSGKSTFIDALMALLLPAGKASFNVAAAQGDKADRSLLSYMRGSFGSAHDGGATRVKSKREGAVVTALRAAYRADDGSELTLLAMFWTTQANNALADVKRVYSVARRNVGLKSVLDAFGDGNARALKQWLRADQAITCCDENFAEYQELYRKLLMMENRNAPALLSRALGLKKIDDLTLLIRELVLEPSGVRDDARKVVAEFADLVAIHAQLLDARQQLAHLARLPELNAVIDKAEAEIRLLSEEKQGLPVYFGELLVALLAERIAGLDAQRQDLEINIKQREQAKEDANRLVERRHEAYLQLGGDRIESLNKELEHTRERLKFVTKESSRYQRAARELEWSDALEASVFQQNQVSAEQGLVSIENDTKASQDRFAEVSAQLSATQAEIRTTTGEIAEITARPGSNIHIAYQRLRDELVDSLGLPAEDCLFIGELLDVRDEERSWQGAIERALGGLRTTLAVPEQSFSMVTKWLNARHTGLHVRVQVVRESKVKAPMPEFRLDGFLRKLVWRQHRYREWLKQHLQRFDLSCVADTATLDVTPFSMTREGLIHKEKGRFEKKDLARIDDRNEWQLGFSNASRLKLLNQHLAELNTRLAVENGQVEQARADWDRFGKRKSLLQRIRETEWESIDAPYWNGRLARLDDELKRLRSSGGDLEEARKGWEAAKQALQEISDAIIELARQRGAIESELASARTRKSEAAADAERGLSESCRESLAGRVRTISIDDLERVSAIMFDIERDLDGLLARTRNDKSQAENSAVGVMSSFRGKDRWQSLTADWPAGLAGLTDFLEHLDRLVSEGLPALVEQFVERLNRHATQSLARIKSRLDSEREDILERIDVINQVLTRTEFKQGSYLKLGSRREKYPHVQDFEKQLNRVLSQVTSDDHEGRFQQLETVVAMLEKASAVGTAGTLESMRLLDPRYQLSFFAEEVGFEDGETRDVLDSSSGKSGGEKESFAGTIVAASLAYVLTPEGHDRPVYCTVFLDEAFSNTAEAVSRRVLKVFKALHMHVNLITPYKNLNLARESARALVIAERDAERHESHLCEITWEEVDRRLAEQREAKLSDDLLRLNIEVEDRPGMTSDV